MFNTILSHFHFIIVFSKGQGSHGAVFFLQLDHTLKHDLVLKTISEAISFYFLITIIYVFGKKYRHEWPNTYSIPACM